MHRLTFQMRRELVNSLASPADPCPHSPEELMTRATTWARCFRSRVGYIDRMSRHVAALCEQIRTGDGEISRLAHAGLWFAVDRFQPRKDRLADVLVLSAEFVLGHLVAELAERRGQPGMYRPPVIRGDERELAEQLFLEYVERPLMPDRELVAASRDFVANNAYLRWTAFFGRFIRNVEFLIKVLENDDDNARWARGGLSYLVEEDDVIHDGLGLVGLLDDVVVVDLAIDLVNPRREPWLEIIERTVEECPFLDELVFTEDEHALPMSEFLAVNLALSSKAARGNEDPTRTALVVPVQGRLPFLLAFVEALRLIQRRVRRTADLPFFTEGETVRVDGRYSAHFDGFETIGGQRWLKLSWYAGRRHDRKSQYIPAGDLWRLSSREPLDWPRGPVPREPEAGAELGAVERMFHLDQPYVAKTHGDKVVAVTPVGAARDFAGRVGVRGQAIRNVIPIAHLRVDGDYDFWSPRFGGRLEPLLLVVSDIDQAAEYIEADDRVDLLVIDHQGANANRPAGFSRLARSDVPIIAVAPESDLLGSRARSVDTRILAEEGFDFWEWDEERLTDTITWPRTASPATELSSFHRSVELAATSKPTVEVLLSEFPGRAWSRLLALRGPLRTAGAEPHPDLHRLRASLYSAFFELLRSAVPLAHAPTPRTRIEEALNQAHEVVKQSLYLSSIVVDEAVGLLEILRDWFDRSLVESPKALALQRVLHMNPNVAVVCRHLSERAGLAEAYDLDRKRVQLLGRANPAGLTDGAVIAAWYARDRMTRFVSPCSVAPLFLLLYDVEQAWYGELESVRRRSREFRRRQSRTGQIFRGLPTPASAESAADKMVDLDSLAQEERLQSIDHLEIELAEEHTAILTAGAEGGATIEAHRVALTGGGYAFFTDGSSRWVVEESLVAGVPAPEDNLSSADGRYGLRLRSFSELRPGDFIVFYSGSDADVIRELATKMLPPGTHDLALLWRRALMRFTDERSMSQAELRRQLAEAGCERHVATVGSWLRSRETIAPRDALKGDLEAIMEVTEDEELAAKLDRCKKAISAVWSAHHKASSMLIDRVVKTVGHLLNEGLSLTDVVEVEDRVMLAEIEEIDERPMVVPSRLTSQFLRRY